MNIERLSNNWRFALQNRLFLLILCAQLLPAQNKFTLPDTVEVKRDIVYAEYGAKKLLLDLYLPKSKTAGPIPGIVVIRGGGWRAGDKNAFAPIAAGLAARGFAAACIEYRVMPEFTIMDAVNDAKAAVRWMRAEGKGFGIRTDAIGAIGGSAGDHLVALLATSFKAAALEGNGGHEGVSSRLQAVVAMAPVVDFAVMPKAVNGIFAGRAELAKQLSPDTYLDKDAAPFLLIHSNADKTVPIAQSAEMLDRCKKLGVPAELVTIDGAPHAFWNMPQWATETIDRSGRFFHSVLDR
jgi:acetyl esterase/lipase